MSVYVLSCAANSISNSNSSSLFTFSSKSMWRRPIGSVVKIYGPEQGPTKDQNGPTWGQEQVSRIGLTTGRAHCGLLRHSPYCLRDSVTKRCVLTTDVTGLSPVFMRQQRSEMLRQPHGFRAFHHRTWQDDAAVTIGTQPAALTAPNMQTEPKTARRLLRHDAESTWRRRGYTGSFLGANEGPT